MHRGRGVRGNANIYANGMRHEDSAGIGDVRLPARDADPDGSVVWVLAGVGLVLVAFTACLYALVWWLA